MHGKSRENVGFKWLWAGAVFAALASLVQLARTTFGFEVSAVAFLACTIPFLVVLEWALSGGAAD